MQMMEVVMPELIMAVAEVPVEAGTVALSIVPKSNGFLPVWHMGPRRMPDERDVRQV